MDTDSTAAQKTTTYHAQALARGLKILNALADTDSATLTLGELREVVELPKSSLIRILSVLEEYDFIRRVSDDGTDRAVGPAVVRLAEAYLASANAGSLIQPYLRELADSLGQTTNAAVLDGTFILHVCVEEPVRPLRYRSHVLRDYAHSTGLGKALLAWLDPAKLASHLPDEPFPARTSHTITSKEAFLEELDAVRDRGYSLDDEESDEGVRCVPPRSPFQKAHVSLPQPKTTASLPQPTTISMRSRTSATRSPPWPLTSMRPSTASSP